MISGVAIGLAERYGLHVTLVRLAFFSAFLATPLAALVYLLLTLSTPSEERISDGLRLAFCGEALDPRVRFEQFSQLLSNRLLQSRSNSWIQPYMVAIWLLVFAAFLELSQFGHNIFYSTYPLFASWSHDLSIAGTALFFISVAFLLLFQKHEDDDIPVFDAQIYYRFSLQRGAGKMIGGVVSGLSQILELDPFFLRVLFIIINIFTIGLAGAAYLLIWYVHRGKDGITVYSDTDDPSNSRRDGQATFRIGLAFLFLLLAGIHLSTSFRLFFFNESLFEGLALAFVGIAIVWRGIRVLKGRTNLWVIGGAFLFFLGSYELVSTIAHLQISIDQQFEVWEVMLALSAAYMGMVLLRGYPRAMGFGVAAVFALSSLFIATGFIPQGYLMELVRFYSFFYPLIFVGLGLWIAFERYDQRPYPA
jgi:phage shock protein PspC (stress-responsive transcriptional regulator)